MARILHVDALHCWREIVRHALPDHRVDVADSSEEALDLVQGGAAYHLALVDLRVVPDRGIVGTGLLGLLHSRYPETRAIAVAAVRPPDAVREELAERFGIEEMLIPSGTSVPDLRHVIEETLRKAVPVDARVRRAELHDRNRHWQRRLAAELDSRVHAADMVARNASGNGPDLRRRARTAIEDARALRERFRADSAAITDRIDRSASFQEVLDAGDAFEHLKSLYADLVGR